MQLSAEVRDAADRGDIVHAIKVVRQETGLGLKQAKALVEGYLRTGRSDFVAANADIPLAAVVALQEGKLIEAVRLTREAGGRGLKDSKAAVEAYLASHLTTREQFRQASGRQGGGWWRRLLTLVGLIAAVLALLHAFGLD